jgi:hypothetical protein
MPTSSANEGKTLGNGKQKEEEEEDADETTSLLRK